MHVLSIVGWVAAVYVLAGAIVALAVGLTTKYNVAESKVDPFQSMLMTLAAWPVVVGVAAIVGIHMLTRHLRPRP